MRPSLRTNRAFLAACGIAAALAIGAPIQASAAGSTSACQRAKEKLKRDERRHAAPSVIRKDKIRIRQACHT